MPTKYKDYPVYTYDEPVTYNDFSGGINTDPSNEHLLANEMRDCLNMHYKSAALVKRKGASLLCTISCEDELFNIQGVFLFTYRTTYIIIAADGKLYQGIYSPNTTIVLTRLRINIPVLNTTDLYNATDTSAGLTQYIQELHPTEKHDGFAHRYLIDEQGNIQSLTGYDNFMEYFELPDEHQLKNGDIVLHRGIIYKLSTRDPLIKINRTPLKEQSINDYTKRAWITLDDYNNYYREDIINKEDLIHYANEAKKQLTPMQLQEDSWGAVSTPILWSTLTYKYFRGQVVSFKDILYVCMKDNFSCTNCPEDIISNGSDTTTTWLYATERRELIFQNHSKIESATYNNILYITTGTRFVQVELIDDALQASIVEPYKCTGNELINIGYNYLSPYPELCLGTTYNQAITSISNLSVIPQKDGRYLLKPQMTFAGIETEVDYFYKWEKKLGDQWVTIRSFKNNIITEDGTKLDCSTLIVDDADKFQYRVTFAKSFDRPVDIVEPWDYTKRYIANDIVSVTESESSRTRMYKCLITHTPSKLIWNDIKYEQREVEGYKLSEDVILETYKTDEDGNYLPSNITPTFQTFTSSLQGYAMYKLVNGEREFQGYYTLNETKLQIGQVYWQEVFQGEDIMAYDINTGEAYTDTDWKVDEIDGEYFGQAASVLATKVTISEKFKIIHSCRKITADGNKFLLYGDSYNSGSWFKTIISNPTYITDRGGLSFKTTKNEELLKVIPFNGVLLAFANSENVGGSIHLINGNGDDYDDSSGYYSPYQRSTINNSISCDNENTIQICENLIVFKYFDTVYYIESSELSKEIVTIHSCNDRLKHLEASVKIPWDDNSCISEVTEDYYALIWKEKYYIEKGELIQERPGLKLKMYYKQGYATDHKVFYPWLRDESDYFNVDHIIYIKGKPIYLYNNTLITFNENTYTDFGKIYKCMIHFRGEDIGYPKMYKLISNVLVYYHRTQSSKLDFDLCVRNEAGHILLDSKDKRPSLQDLRSLREGDILENGSVRLDSTILDSKVFNTSYKFPCLLADSVVTSENNKDFSLSSITYNYTTSEVPDTTAYDLYSNIIRMKEVK